MLDGDAQAVALAAVERLDAFANPDLMHRSFNDFKGHLDGGNFGIISVTTNTLRLEYPDPALLLDELSEIKQQMDELGQFINDADIQSGLKTLLLAHLAYMDFAIRNVDVLGIEAIYAAFAPAVFSARQAALKESPDDNETPKPRREIYERVKGTFQKLLGLIDWANKVTKDLSELEDGISGLLPPS
jgi:hypothetical protein